MGELRAARQRPTDLEIIVNNRGIEDTEKSIDSTETLRDLCASVVKFL
jgi:hypothetical protein